MRFVVLATTEFKTWFGAQERSLRRTILAHIDLLEERGPRLGRPYADTLKGSRRKNLKELRVQHRGDPYRILHAFDPRRRAVLLVGGTKAGDARWYDRMIPKAERLFEAHLNALAKEEDNDDDPPPR